MSKTFEKTPSPYLRESSEFQAALDKCLDRLVQESLSHLIAPENKLRLHHGRSWGAGEQDSTSSEGKLKRTVAETVVPFETVRRNDIAALPSILTNMVEAISSDMKRNVYATVSAAANRTGNVISAKAAGSLAQAYLHMLRTVEFGVDSEGNVSEPSLHLSPEMAKKMTADLNAQGPEFHETVARIKERKRADALRREQERLDKYRK